jgi:hypothetical protein
MTRRTTPNAPLPAAVPVKRGVKQQFMAQRLVRRRAAAQQQHLLINWHPLEPSSRCVTATGLTEVLSNVGMTATACKSATAYCPTHQAPCRL